MDNRYVNFYQVPGSDRVTSSIFNSRQEADDCWNKRWDNENSALLASVYLLSVLLVNSIFRSSK